MFGQFDHSLRGQLSRRGFHRRRWPEISGPQFDANAHVAAVGDDDVFHQSRSIMYGEDFEAASEERMGGVDDLDLLGGSFRLLMI